LLQGEAGFFKFIAPDLPCQLFGQRGFRQLGQPARYFIEVAGSRGIVILEELLQL
jgi:hypothetical protein